MFRKSALIYSHLYGTTAVACSQRQRRKEMDDSVDDSKDTDPEAMPGIGDNGRLELTQLISALSDSEVEEVFRYIAELTTAKDL